MERNYSCTADLVLTAQFIASTIIVIMNCIADSNQATRAANMEVYQF